MLLLGQITAQHKGARAMETATWVSFYFHGGEHNIVTVAKNPPWPIAPITFEKYGKYDSIKMLEMMHTLVSKGYYLHTMRTGLDGIVSMAILVRVK